MNVRGSCTEYVNCGSNSYSFGDYVWYTLCSFVCAWFPNDWYELVCKLCIFCWYLVASQFKSLQLSLKQAKLT